MLRQDLVRVVQVQPSKYVLIEHAQGTRLPHLANMKPLVDDTGPGSLICQLKIYTCTSMMCMGSVICCRSWGRANMPSMIYIVVTLLFFLFFFFLLSLIYACATRLFLSPVFCVLACIARILFFNVTTSSFFFLFFLSLFSRLLCYDLSIYVYIYIYIRTRIYPPLFSPVFFCVFFHPSNSSKPLFFFFASAASCIPPLFLCFPSPVFLRVCVLFIARRAVKA